jgi:hypothetical protein
MIVAGSASPLLLSSAGGYNLTNSLRFRNSASAYLNRTPASAGNRKTWTWSAWVKRGTLGTFQTLFCAGPSDAVSPFETRLRFNDTNTLSLTINGNGGTGGSATTTAVFRDPSAWYHIIGYVDMAASGQANKVRIYVNGVLQTVSYFGLSTTDDTQVNNNVIHRISANSFALSGYFDGYMTEINFIDGQALTPSSFGETSATTGVWQPRRYTGTYGTNGFYLPFTDNSALTTSSNVGLGRDFSGNGNYWTTNNISITAGVTYDSMTDVPTLTSATAANYAVVNPLFGVGIGGATVTRGNLEYNTSVASAMHFESSIAVSSGKWYWEYTVSSGNFADLHGVCPVGLAATSYAWNEVGTVGYYSATGQKFVSGVGSAYGATFTSNDVIGTALDKDANTVTFYKNGVSQGVISLPTNQVMVAYFADGTGGAATSGDANFGQRPFTYTPPTGFVALNTFNLPTPTIGASASTLANKNFDATLYTGTGSTQSIVNAGGFQPDLVWGKNRSAGSTSNYVEDVIRGAGQVIYTDQTTSEQNNAAFLPSFNSNGFSVAGNTGFFNASGNSFVAWQWRANGAAVTNTAGSITSQVSANTSAGFSVVTFTAGSGNMTVGHGLGVTPRMVIVKRRDSASQWWVYHASFSNLVTDYMSLNTTNAVASLANMWGASGMSSTTLGFSNNSLAASSTQVAYCFSQIAGYSAFGSYTGNGSADGTFVFTGFRPRYVMVKRTDAIGHWIIKDTARNPSNITTLNLYADLANVEDSAAVSDFDLLSNGFKLRGTYIYTNASGGSYIYMAFAETPFKYANAR